MLRVLSVLAMTVVAGCGVQVDMTPYLWPEPVYGVPWEAKSFTLRFSDWWNTPDEVREKIAVLCGPGFSTARVAPQYKVGPVFHPNALNVQCGSTPESKPQFRGQQVLDSHILSLKAPAAPKPQ